MRHSGVPLVLLVVAAAGFAEARPAAAPAPAPAATPGAPAPSPAAGGGWSPWLGRPAAQAAAGICPCGSFLTEWNLWYEQGLQATPDDSGPLSGLTALCGGGAGDGGAPGVLGLPGQGLSDFNETFSDGLADVDAQHGTFLDNLLGVGGTGPSLASWACEPGQVITGVEVASEEADASPTGSLVTGARFFCEDPGACAGRPPPAAPPPPPPSPAPPSPPPPSSPPPPLPAPATVPAPSPAADVASPSPEPASPLPPQEAPLSPELPPPESPLPPVEPPVDASPLPPVDASPLPPPPAANWSGWLGPKQGPPDLPIASCPCGFVTGWRLWSDAAFVEGSDSGALYALAVRCAGADRAALEPPLEVLPGGQGEPTAVVNSAQGFSGIKGFAGGLVDSLYGKGGRGPTPFAHACDPPARVVGVEVAVEPRGERQYLAGLRVDCSVPAVASCAAPPPPALPSPSPSPVAPAPEVIPAPSPVVPAAPEAAPLPTPTPTPALPGAPTGAPGGPSQNWSPWLGPQAGPAVASGICPCGSFITSWSIWADSDYKNGGNESGALSGLTAACSGAEPLNVLPDAGDPSGSTTASKGYTSITGLGGATLVNSLLGMGGTGPTPFAQACQPGQLIVGVEIATTKVGTTEYIGGLRVLCVDPASPTCINGLPGIPSGNQTVG